MDWLRKNNANSFKKGSPQTLQSICSADRVTLSLRPSPSVCWIKAKTLSKHVSLCLHPLVGHCLHPLALPGSKHFSTIRSSNCSNCLLLPKAQPLSFPSLSTHSSPCMALPSRLVCLVNFLSIKIQASDLAIPLLDIYSKRTESGNSKSYRHTHIHSSTIHSNQNVDTAQVSISRCLHKEMGCEYKMDYYAALKRKEIWTYDTKMDKPGRHYAKWNKPTTKK